MRYQTYTDRKPYELTKSSSRGHSARQAIKHVIHKGSGLCVEKGPSVSVILSKKGKCRGS